MMTKSILASALVLAATLSVVCFSTSGFQVAGKSRVGKHASPFSAVGPEPSLFRADKTQEILIGNSLADHSALLSAEFKRLPPVETSDVTFADGLFALHRTSVDDTQPQALPIPTQWDKDAIRRIATYWEARAEFAK